jgi:YggT family protein
MPIDKAVLNALLKFLDIYFWLLFGRILLSWFPNISWYNQPFKFIRDVTDPVMEPFRRLIPPIGMIDISPIVLFIVIQLLQGLLAGMCGMYCATH